MLLLVTTSWSASVHEAGVDEDMEMLESMIMKIGDGERVKRSAGDRGVT